MTEEKELEAKEEKPTRKPRKKYIPVKVIASKNKVIIVEWVEDETVQRGILPVGTKVSDGKIEEGVLNTAIPYGVPWDEFSPGEFDAEELASELHKKGIWTYEDAKGNLRMFGQVLLSVIGATRNELLSYAKKFENTK